MSVTYLLWLQVRQIHILKCKKQYTLIKLLYGVGTDYLASICTVLSPSMVLLFMVLVTHGQLHSGKQMIPFLTYHQISSSLRLRHHADVIHLMSSHYINIV